MGREHELGAEEMQTLLRCEPMIHVVVSVDPSRDDRPVLGIALRIQPLRRAPETSFQTTVELSTESLSRTHQEPAVEITLREKNLSVPREEDVRSFDPSVDHSLGLEVGESFQDFQEDRRKDCFVFDPRRIHLAVGGGALETKPISTVGGAVALAAVMHRW